MQDIRVLVATASRHGSTAEIAREIGRSLAQHGFEVSTVSVDEAPSVREYDAVVLGSAVYAGRWLKEARVFAEHHGEELSRLPVWLFSSGPVGDAAPLGGASSDTARLAALLGAVDHRSFAGRLERERLRFGERLVANALRAAEGDYREWDDIRTWAANIGQILLIRSAGRGSRPMDRGSAR